MSDDSEIDITSDDGIITQNKSPSTQKALKLYDETITTVRTSVKRRRTLGDTEKLTNRTIERKRIKTCQSQFDLSNIGQSLGSPSSASSSHNGSPSARHNLSRNSPSMRASQTMNIHESDSDHAYGLQTNLNRFNNLNLTPLLSCTSCDRQFASDFTLRRHQREAHLNQQAGRCEGCRKSFARLYQLEQHICPALYKTHDRNTFNQIFSRSNKTQWQIGNETKNCQLSDNVTIKVHNETLKKKPQ